jgi:transcription antitermination factor NusG
MKIRNCVEEGPQRGTGETQTGTVAGSARLICGLLCVLSFASYQSGAMTTSDAILWYVAHTRPRREKKLAEYCEREGFRVTLPCYRAVHKYRGKTVTFLKPLFPGYVFLQLQVPERQKVYQSDYVANLLDVPDQETFAHQLGDILQALETDLEVCLAPHITAGARVRIKSGPLRGLEGFVQERAGVTMVLLRLDFISQAAAVKIEATELEIV